MLDANLFLTSDDPETTGLEVRKVSMQYFASFYWAIMMTTGLNVAIGPGLREGQIFYECVITFFGVCLQAYMLGATASEIANMDAQDVARRQKLNGVKQHLRAMRVPMFLRASIVEYYERETSSAGSQDSEVLRDMPSSLKVQLAVTLNADFLRQVSFFSNLDGTITAALVLCMRSRVVLPMETIIQQGDVSYALYFIRSGCCEVLKLEGPVGLPSESAEPLGLVVTTLRENACFGEQSFMTQQPALASVRAVGYSTLMRIWKTDFDTVVEMFPQLRVHMLGVQREQMREYAQCSRFGSFRKSRLFGSKSRLLQKGRSFLPAALVVRASARVSTAAGANS